MTKKSPGAGKGSKHRPSIIPYKEYLNKYDQINWNDNIKETHNVKKRVEKDSKSS